MTHQERQARVEAAAKAIAEDVAGGQFAATRSAFRAMWAADRAVPVEARGHLERSIERVLNNWHVDKDVIAHINKETHR